MRLLERENDLTPRRCYLCHGAIRPDEVMEDNRGGARIFYHRYTCKTGDAQEVQHVS